MYFPGAGRRASGAGLSPAELGLALSAGESSLTDAGPALSPSKKRGVSLSEGPSALAPSGRPRGAGGPAPAVRRAGGTYPPVLLGGPSSSAGVLVAGAGAGAEGGVPVPAASAASFAACLSRHVGLLPARVRRGGPEGRSVESERTTSGVRAGPFRSGACVLRPDFFACNLASASSSFRLWMAAFSSSSL